MTTTQKPLTPEPIMRYLFSHVPTQSLCAAVDLDLFSLVKQGHDSAEKLAEASKASLKGIELLTNVLCSMGLMKKLEGQRLALTPESEMFLVRDSRAYLGGMTTIVRMSWDSWAHLTDAVRAGTAPVNDLEGDRGDYFAPWVESLFNLNFPAAQDVAKHLGQKPRRALDIGAGSGVWSLALAQENQALEAVAVDLPQVLDRVTRQFAKRLGVEQRYEFREGDFHQVDFGSQEFDVAYLGHILHSEGPELSHTLLQRIHRALKPGGAVVVAEMIPDENKSEDMFANLFGLNMLVHTHAGTVFSQSELEQMAKAAGFSSVEWVRAAAPYPVMVARR